RTVYIAFNVGELYWRVLQSDHGQLIANSVRWALGGAPPQVEVKGCGLIDVAVRQGNNQLAVSLVNLHHPMAMRGQRHETVPLGTQTVVVRLPEGVESATARLVLEDRAVPATVADGLVSVQLEQLDLFETVHVVW